MSDLLGRRRLTIPSTHDVASRVDRTLSADDPMFAGNAEHYFSCGQSALAVIREAIQLAGGDEPKTILDFGAAAGRVTRWLKADFRAARIAACDLRASDMAFLRGRFGIEAWPVTGDLNALSIPGSYDLIWVGSVITHLSAEHTKQLVAKLLASCNPSGLLAISFHGPSCMSTGRNYIDDAKWQAVKQGYLASGYGYADYEQNSGYGISLTSLDWMSALFARQRIILMGERAWDGHHDVIVAQSVSAQINSLATSSS